MKNEKFLTIAVIIAVLAVLVGGGWAYWSGRKPGEVKESERPVRGPFFGEEKKIERRGEEEEKAATAPSKGKEEESPKFTLEDGYLLALEEARKWDEGAYLGGVKLIFASRKAEPNMSFYFASGLNDKEIYTVLVREKQAEKGEKLAKKDVVGIPLEKARVIQLEGIEKVNLEKILLLGDKAGGSKFSEGTIVLETGIPSFLTMAEKGLWRIVYGMKDLVLVVNAETGKVEQKED